MHRVAKAGGILLFAVAGLPAIAQEAVGPVPYDPAMPSVKIWCSAPPLGDAGLDPRFAQIQRWNITSRNTYLFSTGESVANSVFDMIYTNVLSPGSVAVSLIYVSLGNIRTPAGTPNTTSRIPPLFAHEDDVIEVEIDEFNPSFTARTPWMDNGICEGHAWMDEFASTLDEYVSFYEWIPAPNRFLFDDEPDDIFDGPLALQFSNMGRVVAYWNALTSDPRFSTVDVPGFPNKTLEDLWYDATTFDLIAPPYVPGDGAHPTETFGTHYMGGTASNQKWVVWFFNLMRQAEAGAMQTAYYDTLHEYFPDAKCSDYDRSLRLDGENAGANSWIPGNQRGAEGRRFAWDGKGDLQAPLMYTNTGTYFYDSAYCANPYALTNDTSNELEWCPFEPFNAYSLRLHRFTLDGIVRSFDGDYRGEVIDNVLHSNLAPWVMLPGQSVFLNGSNAAVDECMPITLRGAYGAGMFYSATMSDFRSTLALARSRGSTEFNIWNSTGLGMGTNGMTNPLLGLVNDINSLMNPQTTYTWSRIPQIVDQVWGFSVFSSHVATGTTAGGTSGPLHSLAYAFGDYLQVTPASSGDLRTAVETTFTNSYTTTYGNPTYLQLNIEVASSSDTTLYAWIKDFSDDSWQIINLEQETIDEGVEIEGGTAGYSSVPPAPGEVRRVSVRVGVTADNFGEAGEVIIRTGTDAMASSTGTHLVFYDLVQIVAADDEDYLGADLTKDGVIDCDDMALWDKIYAAAQLSGAPGPIRSMADINGSGSITEDDDEDYVSLWEMSAWDICP